jgi:hypothetical protein
MTLQRSTHVIAFQVAVPTDQARCYVLEHTLVRRPARTKAWMGLSAAWTRVARRASISSGRTMVEAPALWIGEKAILGSRCATSTGGAVE